jgi:hypothetical protein
VLDVALKPRLMLLLTGHGDLLVHLLIEDVDLGGRKLAGADAALEEEVELGILEGGSGSHQLIVRMR